MRPVTDAVDAQSQRRYPSPPSIPPIRVRALKSNWLMNQKPVEVGEVYAVSANEAHRLVHVGKAEFA
jgi:hypothetical protein